MDDFQGLTWDTPKPSNNASSGAALNKPRASNTYDAFSLLAAAPARPVYAGAGISTHPATTQSPSARPDVSKGTVPTQSRDAFGDLFSLGASSSNSVHLSIAERQAAAERERRAQAERRAEEIKSQGAFWDKFDATKPDSSLGPPSSMLSPKVLTPTSRPASAAAVSPSAQPPSEPSKSLDPWADFDLLAPSKPTTTTRSSPSPQPAKSPAVAQSTDIFDFASFDDISTASVPQSHGTSARASSPGNFDFGDREYGDDLLSDHEGGNDDILGDLGKPVEVIQQRRPSPTTERRSTSTTISNTSSRIASPPPHILGQIVEMGFSPQQARAALAATKNGLDVQAALESLLNTADSQESQPAPSLALTEEEEWEQREEARRRRRAGSSRNPARQPPASDSAEPARTDSSTSGLTQQQLKEQADRVLSQASEIGLTMFNRANAFWSTGKASLQKAYEERTMNSTKPQTDPTRPRWAQDIPTDRERERETRRPQRFTDSPGFRDSDHEEGPEDAAPPPRRRPPPSAASSPAPPASVSDLLFAEAEQPRKPYVSPARRRGTRNPEAHPTPTTSAPRTRVASPVPRRKRSIISASPSTLASSKSHRTKGTETYKLGQFAEAVASYTSAIDLLPSGHLALVPLYNNRATARMKIGDHKGATEDCGRVIAIIGNEYNPATEEPLPINDPNAGDGLDLSAAIVKALTKRAEAYESGEKWMKAQEDWEKVIGMDWPAAMKARADALRGVGRCKKMITAESSGGGGAASSDTGSKNAAAPSRPKPKPKPTLSHSPPSEAATRLRQANETQEAEDIERIQLKDAVDGKLATWKGGKENNLRALIASLDTVLWPELGWQKVGMGELITPSQVKIRYMKAIARVHPDKLSAMNVSVEQRMVANGVFGALNEAWNTFKP